jgi:hypothetical protein
LTRNRSWDILQSFKEEQAWDSMLSFVNTSTLERALLSVQLHLTDALDADQDSEVRRVETAQALHEISQIVADLAKGRDDD